MTLGLFYHQATRGPGKVVNNLIKGLDSLVQVNHNAIGDYNGCLNQIRFDLPRNTLMGPNLVITPDNNPYLFSNYKNIVVPSIWVYDLYKQFNEAIYNNIYIWSVGIDTDSFKVNKNITQDCFIYFKNRGYNELQYVRNILDNKKITYSILEYGNYSEPQLIDVCSRSKFCLLLTNTESQGIGYMEILSTNTPCYVMDKKIWEGRCPATSVPYFDEKCGIITDNMDKFDDFLNNISNYESRNYILENHTLKISAQKYLDIVRSL